MFKTCKKIKKYLETFGIKRIFFDNWFMGSKKDDVFDLVDASRVFMIG